MTSTQRQLPWSDHLQLSVPYHLLLVNSVLTKFCPNNNRSSSTSGTTWVFQDVVKRMVGQISLGNLLGVKDLPRPIASARGNTFPPGALSKNPGQLLAWDACFTASMPPSRSPELHLGEQSRRPVSLISHLGHLTHPSHPSPLLLTYECNERYPQNKVVHPIYFENTESRYTEYFSLLLLMLQASSQVCFCCQAVVHKEGSRASCHHWPCQRLITPLVCLSIHLYFTYSFPLALMSDFPLSFCCMLPVYF